MRVDLGFFFGLHFPLNVFQFCLISLISYHFVSHPLCLFIIPPFHVLGFTFQFFPCSSVSCVLFVSLSSGIPMTHGSRPPQLSCVLLIFISILTSRFLFCLFLISPLFFSGTSHFNSIYPYFMFSDGAYDLLVFLTVDLINHLHNCFDFIFFGSLFLFFPWNVFFIVLNSLHDFRILSSIYLSTLSLSTVAVLNILKSSLK